MLPNLPHFCVGFYGILASGGVAVPLNFMNEPNDLQRQLQDCEAKLFISWQGFEAQIAAAAAAAPSCRTLIYLGTDIPANTYSLTQLIAASKPLDPPVPVSPSDTAVVNYTSGIADTALGAELTHEAIAVNAATLAEMFRFDVHDRLLAVLPLFHPFGQTAVMHAALGCGASIVLLPRFKAEEVIRAVQEHQATILPAVPGMLRALCNLPGGDFSMPSLKYCISYGGHLPDELVEEFESRFGVPVLKAYGLTEAGPLVAVSRLDQEQRPGAVGLPLWGVEVQIRGADGRPLRTQQSGEVFVQSPSLMRGYLHHEEETRRRLQDGWLATGDIGYLDMDHFLHIQERKDDLINKGGFEIFPREIEAVLLDFPGVDEAAVIAVPDAAHGHEVKAYVVLKPGAAPDLEGLMRHCEERLPMYKRPKYVEFVDRLPQSPTGRILKRLLRRREKSNSNHRGT